MNQNITTIAYFSAEIGISDNLPTYSGGLGVLAGDHIKSSADAGLPMVGISILYKEGYFKQSIDQSGHQLESYPRINLESELEKLPEIFSIKLRGREIFIQAYKYLCKGEKGQVIPIYFLDTDFDQNCNDDRIISLRLYSGDKDHRILQEALLGIGGIKLLETLGYDGINTYHMNEGHCSFLTLALLDKFGSNENKVKSLCHFTTHTPVDAGHDHFSVDRVRNILGENLPEKLDLPSWLKHNRLHMTELGLYFSRSANGVSKLHGKVAQDQFPNSDIGYITNGVYHPHWLGKSFRKIFDAEISGWRTNPSLLLDLSNLSDDDISNAHKLQKQDLIGYVNSKSNKNLSSDILTIGFARRAAEYKRATLVFSDLERLVEIGKGKLQIVFSGKAHPKDDGGKSIIKQIVNKSHHLAGSIEIVFLENYNMHLGHIITSGVDVWLNTPLRPHEASGTSGMKATLNGIPNLSILDGWWEEGCIHGENGWAIGSADYCNDAADAKSLYDLLESDVIPIYYNNRDRWIQIMRKSIATAVDFTGHRMIKQYHQKFYQEKKEKILNHTK